MQVTNFDSIIKIALENGKKLIGAAILSIILGVIISSNLITKEQFKSSLVFYPVNITQYDNEALLEQVLEIMTSKVITDSLIKKFDLYTRYDVDQNTKGAEFAIYKAFDEHVVVNKTANESIEVTVNDEDPKKAFEILNGFMLLYNFKTEGLQKDRNKEALSTTENQLKMSQNYLDSLTKLAQVFREKYGILQFDMQVEQLTKAAYAKNNPAAKELLINLSKYGNEHQFLMHLLQDGRTSYAKIKVEYFEIISQLNKKCDYYALIREPKIADKKYYPVRWLMVVISLITGLVIAIVSIAIYESLKYYNAKRF